MATNQVNGSYEEQYKHTREYREAILRWNPGSSVFIQKEGLFFQRMYVCMDAYKKWWVFGCRPIVLVDACHLKGHLGGQLMCAIGKDGNNDMFPIAYAVVETKDSWSWFLSILIEDIGSIGERAWTFMSDRQKVKYWRKKNY
jgi:hypothetical protein